MSRLYLDLFKKPISKDDVRLVVQVITQRGVLQPFLMARATGLGLSKVKVIYRLLEDADIVSVPNKEDNRTLYFKDKSQITNTALRQLRKGNA